MKQQHIIFIMAFICCTLSNYAQVKEFTAKGIEKTMAKVNDTLYASVYETSNEEYAMFLDVMTKKDSALYSRYYVDSAKWLESHNKGLAEYYHRHSGFKDYPVVCISYEGAIAYCSWLTDIYNNDNGRKFRKVLFVLPSEQEWELAAMGNNKGILYPWGTNSMRDTRKGPWQGVFLANYKRIGDGSIVSDSSGKPVFRIEEKEPQASGLDDRVFYTAPVNSFFPNNIGIYNQAGNAAEMTSRKGLTKGGSWNSYGGELAIAYKLYFYEPSVEVGFRVFMKIVEK